METPRRHSHLIDSRSSATSDENGTPKRASRWLEKVKTKAKIIATTSRPIDERDSSQLKDNAAFGATHLVQGNDPPTGASAKFKATAPSPKEVVQTILHPRTAIKNKATGVAAEKLSQSHGPQISREVDAELVQAHDDLAQSKEHAILAGERGYSGNDEHIANCAARIQAVEEQRESLRAAWITTRHVRRVRVVPGRIRAHPELPSRHDFPGQSWIKWLGLIVLYYTQDFSKTYVDDVSPSMQLDLETFQLYAERLFMASASWQSWYMQVRSVYRWEEPRVTGRWLALYFGLWYFKHPATYLYAWIIYFVVKNRLYPTKVDDIRESLRRALDRESRAHQIGELIGQHGSNSWLQPIMDGCGPFAQIQLGDAADGLEILSNFYNWRYPQKTAATLFFFSVCLLVSVFGDAQLCLTIVWLLGGITFFLSFPISSRYPQYRHLVSPVKWVFWGIPTHSEWAFRYLRQQAQLARQDVIEDDLEDTESAWEDESLSSETSMATRHFCKEQDLRLFEATWKAHRGYLSIFPSGVRFVQRTKDVECWRITFFEICEMSKRQSKWTGKITNETGQLEICSIDARKYCLKQLKKRDEAFNTIIGFSALQWQSLNCFTSKPETKSRDQLQS